MKKSVKVTFETERLLVITGRKYANRRCQICGDEALMLTVEEAAALARTTARSIYGCGRRPAALPGDGRRNAAAGLL